MFDPQGKIREIPYERAAEARQRGAIPVVQIQDPTGIIRNVPANRVQEAVTHGGKVMPFAGGPDVTWTGGAGRTALQDLMSIFSSQPREIGDIAEAGRVANVQEKAAGRGLPYRMGAAAATFLGADVPGMEQAKTPGEVVGHGLAAAAPYAAGPIAGGLGELARPLVQEKIPQALYRSALRPPYSLPLAESQEAAQTGIKFNIPLTEKGYGKLNRLIADWGTKVDDVIAQDPYRPIDPQKTLGPIRQTRQTFSWQPAPQADLQTIDAIKQEYMDRFTLPQGGTRYMTAEEAQKIKQGTYQRLTSRAYGEAKSAQIEGEKAIARGVKEQLEVEFPELAKLNPQLGKLLDLRPLIERTLNRTGNHFINLGSVVAGEAARLISGSPTLGTGVLLMKSLLDIPAVRSRLAIALNRVGVPLSVASARISAYSYALVRAYQAERRARMPSAQENQQPHLPSRRP